MAKKKMGRPLKEIDWDQVNKLAHIQCTAKEIASFIGVDDDTLCNASKRDHGITFSDYLEQKKEGGRASLRRSQWLAASETKNPTMLVWLGKQYLGQSDKQDIKQEVTGTQEISLKHEDILKLVEASRKKV